MFAQSASLPPLAEQVNVQVINVDATVIDRNNQPVRNLTKDDFEIFEDGKPQTITNFYIVDGASVRQSAGSSPAATEVVPATGRFKRKAILIVDNHFIDKRTRNAALASLRKFIDSDYSGQYEWSISVIGAGVHVLQPFSSDKNTINASLASIMEGRTIAGPAASSGRGVLQSSAYPSNVLTTQGLSAADAALLAESTAALVDADKTARIAGSVAAMRVSARAVIDACRAYTALDGKKLIILVTGGMELDNRPMDVPVRPLATPTPSENDKISGELREEMVREANAANVSLYIVNAAGVVSPVAFDASGGRFTEGATDDVRNGDSFAVALASQTGGMYLTRNAVSDSIKTIDTVSETFYSLGYSPAHYEDGKYHTIDVRVRHKPQHQVLHRSGYLDVSSRDRLEDSLKVAMNAVVSEGTLPLRIDLGGKSVSDHGTEVVVPLTAVLPIRLLTTIRQGRVNTGRVHLYLSIFDDKGVSVGFRHIIQSIDLTDVQMQKLATLPDAKFRYPLSVKLKPGVYSAIVALVDELSEEIGKASVLIDARSRGTS